MILKANKMANNNQSEKPKYTEEEIKKIKECALHEPLYTKPGRLWYSPNSSGYCIYAPPCNGCKMGYEDRANGLWMTGYGEEKNVHFIVNKTIQ